MARTSAGWLSGGLSQRQSAPHQASGCMPQAPASLGQYAAWAALPYTVCRIQLAFDVLGLLPTPRYTDGRALKAWKRVPLRPPPRVHVQRVATSGAFTLTLARC